MKYLRSSRLQKVLSLEKKLEETKIKAINLWVNPLCVGYSEALSGKPECFFERSYGRKT